MKINLPPMARLVVVTFDAQTTKEWLFVVALSACTSWALDPIKTAFVTLALTSLSCKEKRHRTFREASQEMHHARVATRTGLGSCCESAGYVVAVRLEP
jgi:7-keto-8-aminopelargonate synthetase-like enzyme